MEKIYYSLDELAKKWSITGAEILYMAEDGKVVLSMRWGGPGFLNDGSRDSDWLWFNEFVDIDGSNIFPLLLSESNEYVQVDTVYRRDGSKVGLSETMKQISPPIRHKIKFIELLAVLRQEVERVEAKHQKITDTKISHLDEQPLRTIKAIAKHLGKSPSSVKYYKKKKNLPYSKKSNGIIEAYPKELDEWKKHHNI
jgi:hypothetical protein